VIGDKEMHMATGKIRGNLKKRPFQEDLEHPETHLKGNLMKC